MPPVKASSKEAVMLACAGKHGCGVCETCALYALAMDFIST